MKKGTRNGARSLTIQLFIKKTEEQSKSTVPHRMQRSHKKDKENRITNVKKQCN